ncbi:kinase-like protein [Nemania abortiva]|nr:kinase-like protein [Nemania abortiva]
MSNYTIYAPNFDSPFKYDEPLGQGAHGEVFRIKKFKNKGQQHEYFALKRAQNKHGHFQREVAILKALAEVPHHHIMYCLSDWIGEDMSSNMLFPLAHGNLDKLLTQTKPNSSADATAWLVKQMFGVCDAIRYLHHHTLSGKNKEGMKRIGFHHNLKPSNILLFESNEPNSAVWKLGDFGSGAIKDLDLNSTEKLYQNWEASEICLEYNAPEFITHGKASQPNDIWSLACIFLEVLVWALIPEGDVTYFRKERERSCEGHAVQGPMFWCLDGQRRAFLNRAVLNEWRNLQYCTMDRKVYGSILAMIADIMSETSPDTRPNASNLCERFSALQY